MTGDADTSRAASAASSTRWCFRAICAATLLAYIRSFTAPFNLDDYAFVVGNPILQDPSFQSAFKFARVRLIPFGTLFLNYWVGGEEEFGYHVVNFVIHLLATFAVFRLALALCRSPRLQGTWFAAERLPIAAAAAAVFACHPIQIQGVTYIVQRMASLATLFYLGSVLLYVRARNIQTGMQSGRPTPAFAAAALLALAAFLSKENTATLPLAIVMTEWTFYPSDRAGRRLLRLAPFLVLVLVMPLIWYLLFAWRGELPTTTGELYEQAERLIGTITLRAHPRGAATPFQYFLTECLVIPRYLRLVVLPWGFNIDHDVPLVEEWSVGVVAGLAFLTTALVFGIYALRRWPLVGYGIVWFFLGLSIESSFFPIQDPMVEHRMYLAMPGIALLVGVAFASAWSRWRIPAAVIGGVLAAALITLTFLRNELWREPILIWEDALAKSPHKARVHANLGASLHHVGRLDEAIAYYCKALEIDPESHRAETNALIAMSEKMEQQVGIDPSLLEGLPTREDGTVELDVPNPCKRPALKQ
jgi:hypothetical protein